jgi:endonuclease/exonuclease/phosphatase family metal-dependent hydrolase
MHRIGRRAGRIWRSASQKTGRQPGGRRCARNVPRGLVLAAALAGAAAVGGAYSPQPRLPLQVLTWNVEQPQGRRLQSVIDFLISRNSDVIALQEIYEQESEDLRSQLRSRTAKPWDGRFHRGVMLLTRLPILDRGELWMPYPDRYGPGRAAVRVAVQYDGVSLQIFNTHLACCDDVVQRQREVNALIEWMGRYPQPALASGDFNAVPTDPEIHEPRTPYGKGMAAEYEDMWTAPGGETHRNPQPSRRIDYWFHSKTGAGPPLVQEAKTLDVCTGWSFSTSEAGQGGASCLSDHKPVEVTLQIDGSSFQRRD